MLERENALKVSVLFRKLRPPLETGGFAALVAPLVSFCAIPKKMIPRTILSLSRCLNCVTVES